MEEADKITKSQVILGVVALPLVAVASAFTISTLWAWFVTPLGVAHISMWHASGITIFYSFFVRAKAPESKTFTRSEFSSLLVKGYAELFVKPIMLLAMGYVAHRMM